MINKNLKLTLNYKKMKTREKTQIAYTKFLNDIIKLNGQEYSFSSLCKKHKIDRYWIAFLIKKKYIEKINLNGVFVYVITQNFKNQINKKGYLSNIIEDFINYRAFMYKKNKKPVKQTVENKQIKLNMETESIIKKVNWHKVIDASKLLNITSTRVRQLISKDINDPDLVVRIKPKKGINYYLVSDYFIDKHKNPKNFKLKNKVEIKLFGITIYSKTVL